tara:strand:+ start:2032 stop:2451 length:420 start_codon:yes stop_codon:yes gene_type:complete
MISLKEYKKLRELLHGSEEDYEVACENIKNIKEITSVIRMMFAKSLTFGRRQDFCQKFNIDYHDIKEWNKMFKDLDNTLGIRTEQEIVEFEIHEQMLPVFTSTWSFIKDVKIELDWEHKKPIKELTKAEMREIEDIIND